MDTPRAMAAQALRAQLDPKFFLALGEPTRLAILEALVEHGRADVAAIAARLPQDRTVISRHLAQLEEAGLLVRTKEGRHVFYDLDPQAFIARLRAILAGVEAAVAACCPPDA